MTAKATITEKNKTGNCHYCPKSSDSETLFEAHITWDDELESAHICESCLEDHQDDDTFQVDWKIDYVPECRRDEPVEDRVMGFARNCARETFETKSPSKVLDPSREQWDRFDNRFNDELKQFGDLGEMARKMFLSTFRKEMRSLLGANS